MAKDESIIYQKVGEKVHRLSQAFSSQAVFFVLRMVNKEKLFKSARKCINFN